MKKLFLSAVCLLAGKGLLLAQEMNHMAEQHQHEFVFTKPGAFVANAIVWGSVAVVIFTLYITLKYIFFPGENDPKHIKNIVTDGYIEKIYGHGREEY